MSLRKPDPRPSRGQALMEMTVVTPLILILSFGVIDIGRALFAWTALEDAVHEGSLYAAHNPSDINAIRTRVLTSSNHPEVTGATVSVVCTTAPAPGTVTVSAYYDLPIVAPVVRQLFGNTIRLSKTNSGTNFAGVC